MRFRLSAAAAGALMLAAVVAPPAHASSANVAALQVAMRGVHLYGGSVDGIAGPATRGAVRRFQRRHRLTADGVAGPATRRALGRRGNPPLGSRTIQRGNRGWDVAALQFLLRRRGASPGSVDGGYGAGTSQAVRRFQSRVGLGADGVAGPATIRAVRHRATGRSRRSSGVLGGSVLFFRPVRGPIGDGFGNRWGRPHQGIDFPVPRGTRVGAAGRGVTRFAGWNSGGYGYLVIVTHRLGFETWYAHLSRITTWAGESVTGGTRIGYVGSTGHSTGPHLHFEVRHNGVPINPMPRLLGRAARSRHPGCSREKLQRRGQDRGRRATVC